jgi:hypothetical protein
VAELISKNRVHTPKIASQLITLRAGPLAPLLSESSVPGSIVFLNIKSLCSDLHDLTDSLFGKFHVPDNSFNAKDQIVFKLSFYGQLLTCIVIYNAPGEIGRPCKNNLRRHFETAQINAKNGRDLAATNG